MIVSYRHNFIFVHCRKVAGSSIKVALAPFLGDRDIVIGSWNEILRRGMSLNSQAASILRTPTALIVYTAARVSGKSHGEAVNRGIKGYYRNRLSRNPPHPTAEEASQFFQREWRKFFKFAFVRNPYSQAASDYYWRVRMTGKKFSFAEYLELLKVGDSQRGIIHPGGASNWDMISLEGKIAVDFIGKFESLEEDFRAVSRRLNIRTKSVGAREKVNQARSQYKQLYGKKEKALVQDIFAPEIEIFGYEFPY